jgi:peroxiredoxin Q/BCP
MAAAQRLHVGDLAPDFRLPAANGELVRLSAFRGRAAVVLFFYPKDNSSACTAEACSFCDRYALFRAIGAELLGVSGDSSRSHHGFAERFRLPFLLLSDTNGAVQARYGVAKTFGLIPGRTTYMIDRDGIIRHIFSSQFLPTKHVSKALGLLRKSRDAAPN